MNITNEQQSADSQIALRHRIQMRCTPIDTNDAIQTNEYIFLHIKQHYVVHAIFTSNYQHACYLTAQIESTQHKLQTVCELLHTIFFLSCNANNALKKIRVANLKSRVSAWVSAGVVQHTQKPVCDLICIPGSGRNLLF